MSFKPFKYKYSFTVMYYIFKNVKDVVGSCEMSKSCTES